VAVLRVGFIGVGVMGRPMALNLLKGGFPVTVYARTPAKADDVVAAGAALAGSPRELAAGSDVLITMVPNSPQVREVLLGPDGVLAGTPEGLIVVDMSTIAPAASREIGAACAAQGISFMDAPVSGGAQGAQAGTLTIMAGGDAETFARVRPVFAAMGKPENIFHVGPLGSGQVIKLANQVLCGVIAAANAEALILGAKAGADVATMAKIIGVSSGANWQLAAQYPVRVFNGSFEPGFMTDLLQKDLGLALELGEQEHVPLPLTGLTRQLYEAPRAKGYGRRDYTSLVLTMEETVGVQLRTDGSA